MANDTKALHAYLSVAAGDTFQDTADNLGVSKTGLLEALAQELGTEEEGSERLETLAKMARQLDANRRRRGGK